MTDTDLSPSLDEIHDAVSSVHHDLNNPLSIISGNAQFLLELSEEKELDDQFTSSVEDIQEATRQMASALQRLERLKRKMDQV